MGRSRRHRIGIVAGVATAIALALGAWGLLPAGRGGLPGQAVARAEGGKQLYTCGMHPNVIQEEPGVCPICGMDLTPLKQGTAGKTKRKKKGKRKIKYWRAPMDPTYVRDKPGKSPMGMDLVPVYEDDEEEGDAEGTIRVDPVMVQNMGVRVAPVTRGELHRSVRTIGEVVVAEDLVSVVNLKFSGWVEKLYVDETGIRVRKGQPLFTIYSPELVSAQEEFLLAVRSAGKQSPLARSARTRLRLWDLSNAAIDAIARRGKVRRTLTISSPRTGYVLHKSIIEGSRVQAGRDLFRIGRLSAIWVHVQVYEFDAPWIALGQRATMELSFERGKRYEGRVSYIYPTLNRKSRTLTVRLEFVNPELRLKPGMFTTVRIETRKRDNVIRIPTEAIIHTGERQIVFVTNGVGKYAPRSLVTGMSGDGHLTEIISGVKEGEVVVVSGQFLLDSESQLQEAVQKLLAARLQASKGVKGSKKGGSPPAGKAGKGAGGNPASRPAAGQAPKHGAAGHEHAPGKDGKVWTCTMHPQIAEPKPGRCPICGMNLVEKKQ